MPVVLVLEDDPSIQASMCTMLAHSGYAIRLAQTVDEALAILRSTRIDAVSLDVRVPDPQGLDRTGLTLLALIRSTADYDGIPVIVFTGMPLSADEEEAVRQMDAAVFYKPQPYSVLIQHLNMALQRPAAPARQRN